MKLCGLVRAERPNKIILKFRQSKGWTLYGCTQFTISRCKRWLKYTTVTLNQSIGSLRITTISGEPSTSGNLIGQTNKTKIVIPTQLAYFPLPCMEHSENLTSRMRNPTDSQLLIVNKSELRTGKIQSSVVKSIFKVQTLTKISPGTKSKSVHQ